LIRTLTLRTKGEAETEISFITKPELKESMPIERHNDRENKQLGRQADPPRDPFPTATLLP
jgi:hypothetical protein